MKAFLVQLSIIVIGFLLSIYVSNLFLSLSIMLLLLNCFTFKAAAINVFLHSKSIYHEKGTFYLTKVGEVYYVTIDKLFYFESLGDVGKRGDKVVDIRDSCLLLINNYIEQTYLKKEKEKILLEKDKEVKKWSGALTKQIDRDRKLDDLI